MFIHSRFRSCNDETPSAVTDLTPLGEYVGDFIASSGYDNGDDRLFSCGGSNEDVLHRQRSGTTSTAFNLLNRAMSQSPTSASASASASASDDFDDGRSQEIRRSHSSYRQQPSMRTMSADDDLVVIQEYE
jgi:hypothetical protein